VLRARYAADWQDWPTAYGAPFYDDNNNGVRDPVEEPGLLGADMVIWFVATDDASPSIYGCPPAGLEAQITWWAYKGSKHALG
ncbi:hypothetical protein, partial [Salmonella enterica]|uniref:hypothetical protein n=1 Tax=Salmonella enterica TaxID=28901 RepID=UPI003299030C